MATHLVGVGVCGVLDSDGLGPRPAVAAAAVVALLAAGTARVPAPATASIPVLRLDGAVGCTRTAGAVAYIAAGDVAVNLLGDDFIFDATVDSTHCKTLRRRDVA